MLEEVLEKIKKYLNIEELPKKGKDINELLHRQGSGKRICLGFYGAERNLIFGDAREEEIEGHRVIFFEQEEAQTPNNYLSIVAIVGDGEIFIREEICREIFRKKWVKLFDLLPPEKKKNFYHPGRNIGFCLKKKTLDVFNIKNKKNLFSCENIFLRDMISNTLYHEFGHELMEIDQDSAALGEATKVFGENILVIFKELLADWLPHCQGTKGTIQNIIDIASQEKDQKRATRMFYLYLSDSWFLETKNTLLYPYTYLIASLLVGYINKDQSVDFVRLDRDLEFIYKNLLEQYHQMVGELMSLTKKATFGVKGTTLNFSQISLFLKSDFHQEDGYLDENGESFKEAFWVNVLKYIIIFSPQTHEAIKNYFKAQEEKLLSGVKENLMEKMKELGFQEEAPLLEEADILHLVMEELNLQEEEKKLVLANYDRLLHGDYLRMGINYNENPHPFYRVLQKMLKDTKLGRIEDGMTLDVQSDTPLTQENLIDLKLNHLADYFKRGAFRKIRLLRIDKNTLSPNKMQEIILNKFISEQEKLGDKIEKIEYQEMENDHLFEVFVPIEDGYLDWNTAQAIWRINQEIRPNEKEKEWVLDREVFSLLTKAYLTV